MTKNNSSHPLSILIVDDEAALRRSLELNLAHAGYIVEGVGLGNEALERILTGSFSIVLCDQQLPDISGIEFTKRCREMAPNVVVVLMTGFGSLDLAITAMRAGAYDYIAKPFELDEIILTLKKIEEREYLKAENEKLRAEVTQQYSFANIVSQSDEMKKIFETVKRLGNFTTTVLITGESGTGKELLARAIHHNSPRRGQAFVAINCGAIPGNLVESELFGHRKGAFTDAVRDKKGLFEEASGGTIFLDEIGELPLHLQVNLLRVLQEQQIRRVGDEQTIPVDVRVIAATLRDLEKDVVTGRFRDDLFYRLNVVSIQIPALRERPEDIPVLVEHFITKLNKKLGLKIKDVSPETLRCLMRYCWRGNVRELENCIERASVMCNSDTIDLDSLPEHIRANEPLVGAGSTTTAQANSGSLSIKERTKELEIDLIRRALDKTRGNRTHAARILEISHRALLYKLKEYGFVAERDKPVAEKAPETIE